VAINPPSDIVLDVLNAADPSRVEATTERLNALAAGASSPTASEDFAQALDAARQSSDAALSNVVGMADARAKLSGKEVSALRMKNAQVEFEATLLNNMVGEMLPKDAAGIFGQGAAGDVWRSMLGDQIAHQIAKSGELGLAKRLFATHELARQQSGAHASLVAPAGAANVAQTSANLLSLPSSADFRDGAFLFAKTGKSS
jgi:flagellar protein FlgJ